MKAVLIFSMCLIGVLVVEVYPRAAKKVYVLSSLSQPFSQEESSALKNVKRSKEDKKIGSNRGCPKGHVYDFYFGKCREIVCAIPGYVIKDGK
ncbi:hypothetical protein NPIL_28651 [Nephila pilipes]|uniref:Spider venom protein n=1 Tax=Nephila pilipes TaxID=299642 RepID=A0A8X6NQV3_NEPPI|nr:hypothetical protein NPIL_657841 [Nephila pilipes]GFT06514.1 hypothetical protein NPIL_284861 [Nephila pilipes]GFT26378.1 hypothetical protein NPIL_387331 [Nephila pilipes]GFT29515.1 hypothetical protein NPIL_28651 [Nephila pilipes]